MEDWNCKTCVHHYREKWRCTGCSIFTLICPDYKRKDDKISEELICDDCGKRGEDVRNTTCPYTEELYDEVVDATLCDDCYRERLMDI
jgi:hypothetical protein